jgi:hypothetical protein
MKVFSPVSVLPILVKTDLTGRAVAVCIIRPAASFA